MSISSFFHIFLCANKVKFNDLSKLSSANALQKRSTFFTYGRMLTLYHAIPTFNDWERIPLKILLAKEKPAFSPFPTIFSLQNIVTKGKNAFPTIFSFLLKTEIIILSKFNLSSAYSLNLVQSKNLLFW